MVRAEYNKTSGTFTGTPCVPISTSYTKLVCQVGTLVPTETRSIEDDVPLVVNIDGQITTDFISPKAVKTQASAYCQDHTPKMNFLSRL